MNSKIIHHPDKCRFEVYEEGKKGFLSYSKYDGGIIIRHVVVPKEIGGRGIAGRLVATALEYVRESGLKVKAECSYAQIYIERRKESLKDLL